MVLKKVRSYHIRKGIQYIHNFTMQRMALLWKVRALPEGGSDFAATLPLLKRKSALFHQPFSPISGFYLIRNLYQTMCNQSKTALYVVEMVLLKRQLALIALLVALHVLPLLVSPSSMSRTQSLGFRPSVEVFGHVSRCRKMLS